MPYFTDAINHIWGGLYCGILYTTTLLVAITFSPARADEAFQTRMTWVRGAQHSRPAPTATPAMRAPRSPCQDC